MDPFYPPHSSEATIIQVSNLMRRFGDRAVINNISFEILRGETLVIMGGSGCGKSTLLRHIIGVMRPSSGSIRIFGEEITDMRERELDNIRRRFGMLFQSGALLASIDIAAHKARTAVKFRRETKVFETNVQSGNVYQLTLDDVVASRGGIPLISEGKLVGAIGCSGGSGSQDEVVAKAGVAAFK